MKIGIAGLGNVGVGVIELLHKNADVIAKRCGFKFEIVAVSARVQKERGVDLKDVKWCVNPLDLVATNAEVIIELIGGESGVALELVRQSLANKKHVITANKAMLAHHGGELAELAEKNNVQLRYEAAVAGGIPVIKVLREGLAGNRVTKIAGILNGTCNYILTEMEARGLQFPEILKEAQAKGYAEADPSFDTGGIDAAHKLAILAANAFGRRPNFKELYVEGIDKITLTDITLARKMGYRIKHICSASEKDGRIEQHAYPCLLANTHPLSSVDGVFNAVEIDAEPVGRLVLNGRGAGAGPTASAVIADLIDIAEGRFIKTFNMPIEKLKTLQAVEIDDLETEFYLRLNVVDKPGVLEEITAVFKAAEISIHKFLQDDVSDGMAQIIIITHMTLERTLKKAVAKLAGLASVREEIKVIRIYE